MKQISRTEISIKKNDSMIAIPLYYELRPWNYINGQLTYKSNKELYRFRKDEIFLEGDSLTFWAKNVPERIERDNINFIFNFSVIDKDTKTKDILQITENTDNILKFFRKTIVVKVELSPVEKEKSGEIIRIDFLKIDSSIDVKIAGYEFRSTEDIDKYVYPFELILWNEELYFEDVKKKVGEHLKTALNIDEFSIVLAKQEKDLENKDVWRINVEFEEKIGDESRTTSALFTIDATTGEVKQFMKGSAWRF